jgi:hypothetical protein
VYNHNVFCRLIINFVYNHNVFWRLIINFVYNHNVFWRLIINFVYNHNVFCRLIINTHFRSFWSVSKPFVYKNILFISNAKYRTCIQTLFKGLKRTIQCYWAIRRGIIAEKNRYYHPTNQASVIEYWRIRYYQYTPNQLQTTEQ